MKIDGKLIFGCIIFLLMLIILFVYFFVLAGEGDNCLSRRCRPPLECRTPCFIENRTGEKICAMTMVCVDPNKPLEVKELEFKPVSYSSPDFNGSL